eukprot:6188242-Pleurochrysis_carterae.AAC.1
MGCVADSNLEKCGGRGQPGLHSQDEGRGRTTGGLDRGHGATGRGGGGVAGPWHGEGESGP